MSARRKQLIALSVVLVCVIGSPFSKRAAGGGNAAENAELNGLPRAIGNRADALEYVRRSLTPP